MNASSGAMVLATTGLSALMIGITQVLEPNPQPLSNTYHQYSLLFTEAGNWAEVS